MKRLTLLFLLALTACATTPNANDLCSMGNVQSAKTKDYYIVCR